MIYQCKDYWVSILVIWALPQIIFCDFEQVY